MTLCSTAICRSASTIATTVVFYFFLCNVAAAIVLLSIEEQLENSAIRLMRDYIKSDRFEQCAKTYSVNPDGQTCVEVKNIIYSEFRSYRVKFDETFFQYFFPVFLEVKSVYPISCLSNTNSRKQMNECRQYLFHLVRIEWRKAIDGTGSPE
jgi:hypothetical protein